MKVQERFLNYVKMDTQSDENSTSYPTTAKQLVLAEKLVSELKELGLNDAHVDEFGIVYATLEANAEAKATMGFIAHMDTAPDMSGKDVKPRIVENYDGKDIVLNEELNIVMKPENFESLYTNVGEDLIVTDGTTLLGADDKAGIAEIMTMLECVVKENRPHGTIKVSFTPDEEVGKGTDNFDVEKFGADYAYTVDGGEVDSIDYENFNAAGAKITIHGTNIHPGSAKGKMVNSVLIGMELQQLLPTFENPMYTEGYEGFFHLIHMQGDCETTHMEYIIRNHNDELFAKQKETMVKVCEFLNFKYGDIVECVIEDSYANMRSVIEKDMSIVDQVKEAMKEIGLNPVSNAIRGGTDGARLTYDGLPCPNLGTGGYNYHGKYEYASIQQMEKSVELLLKIVEKSLI